jgi:PAS domain S-box-containing protein
VNALDDQPQWLARIIRWERCRALLTIALISALGWLRWKGESLGWYPTAAGTTLLVLVVAAVCSVVFLINRRILTRVHEIARRDRDSLRESEEQYRLLFSSMEEGFCTIELKFDENNTAVDYRFLEVNHAFERQTGLKEAKGKWMRQLAPEHEQHWFDIYGKVALTGESVRLENHADALHRLYEVSAFRLGAPALHRVGIVLNDVTERQQREEEMRMAKEEAERASRTKDTFLAALSHELRTPLTPVLMTASVLCDDSRLSLEVRHQLAMMKRNIEIEARLIDDLLDLTRAACGKFTLRLEPCDLHSVIPEAIEMVRSEAAAKSISLKVELGASHSSVVGDPPRLQQVLWNLLKNAVKFTPESGQVEVCTREHDGQIIVEVGDTGIGIELDAVERIFLPFEQAEQARRDKRFGGLGLGLSISKTILKLHGGTIEAESAGQGEGATFRIELPLTDDISDKVENMSSPEPRLAPKEEGLGMAATSLRVLLVEDHEPTIQVLGRFLTQSGYQVTTATTVAGAMAAAGKDRFDVVISDLGLPDGTGFELMQDLQTNYRLRGIALSGYGMDEDLRRSREAGFGAHLIKPIDFRSLQQAVTRLVRS